MLALLFLAAAAQAIPIPKIIPIFELAELQTRVTLENVNPLKAPCLEDCHHYILDQPIYIIAQPEMNGPYKVHFTPHGLNSLGRSPITIPINEHLATEQQMVTFIAPLGKFPFELFPGILQQEFLVPEHKVKLIDMYKFKDVPVVAIMHEMDFKKIAEQFTRVADLGLMDNVYHIEKDYALARRLTPAHVTAPVPALAPAPVPVPAPVQVPQQVQKELDIPKPLMEQQQIKI